ncbi:MAG: hypothetical protein DMF78_21620 [Acidobacteria bacterium]|nr:MAG: hypothetical protein DMF78_21620 [Acidobacteriota bacterium]
MTRCSASSARSGTCVPSRPPSAWCRPGTVAARCSRSPALRPETLTISRPCGSARARAHHGALARTRAATAGQSRQGLGAARRQRNHPPAATTAALIRCVHTARPASAPHSASPAAGWRPSMRRAPRRKASTRRTAQRSSAVGYIGGGSAESIRKYGAGHAISSAAGRAARASSARASA